MCKEVGEAQLRLDRGGGRDEVNTAFCAWALPHAGYGDEETAFRLVNGSLLCWGRGCDELRSSDMANKKPKRSEVLGIPPASSSSRKPKEREATGARKRTGTRAND